LRAGPKGNPVDLVVLNTGGTFNKRYDSIKGELFVPCDNRAVEAAVAVMAGVRVEGLIYKDSLYMDDADRARLVEAIGACRSEAVVVVHGTDTMHLSAKAVAKAALGSKRVVFTGAMVPFFIDPVEATANLALALGAIRCLDPGVYVAMHGLVGPYEKVVKNRTAGRFEWKEASK